MSKKLPSSSVFAAAFEPRSETQARIQRLWPSCDVMVILGPAGTGKTICSCGLAALDIKAGKYERLVVLRPAVEADRTLGFVPGTLEEKVAPLARPVVEALGKVSFNFPPAKLQVDVLGLTRGLTYYNSIVLLTEAQNCTYKQLKLVVTRLGPGSKLIVEGDPEQSDVRPSGTYHCDLDEFADDLDGCSGVGVVEFSDKDVIRHPRLKALLARLR